MMPMRNPNLRLIIYAALMTVGVALMLLGITWLMFFGVALIVLAAYFSSRPWVSARHGVGFVVILAAAVDTLVRHSHQGDAFARETMPLWFWVSMIVLWLWAVLSEFHKSWKNGARHDA